MEENCVGGIIPTASGVRFNILKPDQKDMKLNDIIQSLSNQTRYLGHIGFYSVAEHLVRCYTVALDLGLDDDEIRWALAHDFTEAWLGDVPRPIKVLLPEYNRIEGELLIELSRFLSLALPIPSSVKQIDLDICHVEIDVMAFNPKMFYASVDRSEESNLAELSSVLVNSIHRAGEFGWNPRKAARKLRECISTEFHLLMNYEKINEREEGE